LESFLPFSINQFHGRSARRSASTAEYRLIALIGTGDGVAAAIGELVVGAVVDGDDGEREADGVGEASDVGDKRGLRPSEVISKPREFGKVLGLK